MNTIIVDDKRYEVICYRKPLKDDTWLSVLGTVWHGLNGGGYNGMGGARAILRLIRPTHTFGGVVFEETGEERIPSAWEWMLDDTGYLPIYVTNEDYMTLPYKILRPVALASSL